MQASGAAEPDSVAKRRSRRLVCSVLEVGAYEYDETTAGTGDAAQESRGPDHEVGNAERCTKFTGKLSEDDDVCCGLHAQDGTVGEAHGHLACAGPQELLARRGECEAAGAGAPIPMCGIKDIDSQQAQTHCAAQVRACTHPNIAAAGPHELANAGGSRLTEPVLKIEHEPSRDAEHCEAREAGNDVMHHRFDGMIHGFLQMDGWIGEAGDLRRLVADYLT